MLLTAVWGWTVERIAYRPLRESFRLAPLITAIGMSIVLQNFIQVAQGARVKPLQPVVTGGYVLFEQDGFSVNLSNIQILIVVTTLILMSVFWLIITRTALGRAQRACEQDRLMAALVLVFLVTDRPDDALHDRARVFALLIVFLAVIVPAAHAPTASNTLTTSSAWSL